MPFTPSFLFDTYQRYVYGNMLGDSCQVLFGNKDFFNKIFSRKNCVIKDSAVRIFDVGKTQKVICGAMEIFCQLD